MIGGRKMPAYRNECEMGADRSVIGFPHLVACMGVACVADGALYGIPICRVGGTAM